MVSVFCKYLRLVNSVFNTFKSYKIVESTPFLPNNALSVDSVQKVEPGLFFRKSRFFPGTIKRPGTI